MTRVALLIGTGTYAEGLSLLPAAPRDVEAISTVLSDPEMGGFERVDTLIDKPHTTIAETIETWFRERQRDDVALLYISGHGVKDAQLDLYFAACNTRKQGGDLVRSTAVAASFVRDRIRESKAKRQVIILDCCFSGAIDDRLPKGDETINLEFLLGEEGRVILTSSSSIQYSFAQREGALSLYTHYLVEGIRTGAADTSGDGAISVQELHNYASRKVQEESPAMTPKIIVMKDEGYQIRIAKAPLGDPAVKYRKAVEAIVQEDGETIDEVLSRPILQKLQAQLKLTDEVAQAIESEVLEPMHQRQVKIQQYREFFIRALEHKPSLGERERKRLQQYQQALGLVNENIQIVEAEILAQTSPIPPLDPIVDGSESDSRTLYLQEESQPILPEPLPLTRQPVDHLQQDSNSTPASQSSNPGSGQKSRDSLRSILFGSAVVVVACLGAFLLTRNPDGKKPIPTPTESSNPASYSLEPVQNLISAGDNTKLYGSRSSSRGLRNLVEYRDELIKGINEFVKGNYEDALNIFKRIRENTTGNEFSDPRKDPEPLIFQNNSQARLNHNKQVGSPIYTIAAAVPLSDADEREFNFGQQILFGIAHAQSKAIEQGINLEVVIANDRNLPSQGEALAKELSKLNITGFDNQQREILAVIGHYSSAVTCSALPFYNKAGLAVVSSASVRTDLRSACDGEKVFFRTVSSSAVEAQALVDYLFEKSGINNPKIAVFYNKGEGYSQSLFEQFNKVLGGRAQATPFDLSKPLNFEKGTFNVLAVFPDGRTSNRIAFDRANELIAKDAGSSLILGSSPLYSSLTVINPELSNKLGVQLNHLGEGLVLSTDWFPGCGSKKAFVGEANKIWGGEPNRIYALSYEATQVLVDRLTHGKTTRASILDDLGNSKRKVNSSVFEDKTISFDQKGDRNEIENRILVTPRYTGSEFEPVPGEQSCSPSRD